MKMGKISESLNFFDIELFWPFLLESLIHLVFLPPSTEGLYSMVGSIYVQYNFDFLFPPNINLIPNEKTLVVIYYGLSNVLTIFILFRFYNFIRIIYTFSVWSRYFIFILVLWQ